MPKVSSTRTKLRDMTAMEGLSFAEAFAKSLEDEGVIATQGAAEKSLCVTEIETPLGAMVAIADGKGLMMLEFFDRRIFGAQVKAVTRASASGLYLGENTITAQIKAELAAFFAGHSAIFRTPLTLHGTEFVQSVWRALLEVPAGETCSYGALARTLDHPRAVRAVAQANGANRLAIIVPCHRVIGADGSLTGYGGGLWRKRWLLDHEARHFGKGLL